MPNDRNPSLGRTYSDAFIDKRIPPASLSDEQWQAVAHNDASYDGRFYYAVKTTGIFCRPSCKSRLPNRENVGLFMTAEQAIAARFRPCKRCKPTGQRLPDEEWIRLVTEYIDTHYHESLTLEALALMSHGTPYHLHRTFRRVKGMTPVDYIQLVRIDNAKQLLVETDRTVAEIGEAVGLANTPYFITLFKKKTGLTPIAYRQQQRQQAKENNPYDNI
ncbi:AraC family transcriptional regulator of adaptative response / methylphosphotriester-DNA alkyltransferase methyltransferase [Paenibacillus cellulosilyticus]|uniref:AraC family transcriptional regulator of adaptative response / methylphosphotriester-DNA alkyltransferase methyltransferase n=1 Tax=Paenibacillus cellulosilyticus TaxID=375489 RepID=A0A2V2YTY5_9BACL|nr:bifunctional transcriptional activator/DNA repair enzyme AdaA [Paenibacillus cellulosilyticus]PWW02904.1 AraC family transcriptional regulator of adaptative response / methylphosphotriester-DNA alkyltransferase methyltransferase [Paenibacillus cellulosilyticus]QKS45814.1 methylphosphotriester-DNA--protein-cysteine methyltransferase family protein [Paenibacillus cellulosilyticus]